MMYLMTKEPDVLFPLVLQSPWSADPVVGEKGSHLVLIVTVCGRRKERKVKKASKQRRAGG